jgi:hypothetical protein
MSRIINDHRVMGKELIVSAADEAEAKKLAIKGYGSDWWAWEVTKLNGDKWAVYIARHDHVFALND